MAGRFASVITAACGRYATLGENASVVTIASLGGKCALSSGSCTMFFFFGSPSLAPYSVSLLTRVLVIVLPAFSLNSPQFLLSGLGGCFSSQDIPYTEASKLGKVFEQVRGLSEEVHWARKIYTYFLLRLIKCLFAQIHTLKQTHTRAHSNFGSSHHSFDSLFLRAMGKVQDGEDPQEVH